MMHPGRINTRVTLTILFVALVVAVVVLDQRRRDAEQSVADLLQRIEVLEQQD